MGFIENMEFIRKHLGEEEILCQMAEEAVELAQAAETYRFTLQNEKAEDGMEAARRGLIEEIADNCLLADVFRNTLCEEADKSFLLNLALANVENGTLYEEGMTEIEFLKRAKDASLRLAKAALKYRRALTKKNPTPLTEDEAEIRLFKEIASVLTSTYFLYAKKWGAPGVVIRIEKYKLKRWVRRIKGGYRHEKLQQN